MKIFVDTNIFLDVILKRNGFYAESSKIWSLVSEKRIKGFISAISVNNLYYILKKLIKNEKVNELISQILEEFEIISLTKDILRLAKNIEGKDFEDSIQYFSAIMNKCDYIVTRDKTGFPDYGIKSVSPKEFLNNYL